MRHFTACCLLAILGLTSDGIAAQDLLPAPQTPQPQSEVVPTPAVPHRALRPMAPAPYLHPAPTLAPPIVLYENVRIHDRCKIHPLAVPTIVEVPDPCDRHCTVCIEICAPPCPCVKVRRHGLLGRKMEFDYGDYEVDVVSRHGVITIDYDA